MSTQPDWNVAIIDGQPELVVNLAAVAALAKLAPIGEAEALRRLEASMPAEAFAQIKELVK